MKELLQEWGVHHFSTFQDVKAQIVDTFFDYIIIVIGTEASENKIFSSIVKEIPPGHMDIHIMDLNKLYPMRRDMVEEFPK